MRLFLGSFATIYNYEDIKNELSKYFEGKWVEPQNIHMTFHFFGDISNPSKIIESLDGIEYPKRTFKLKRYGTFGRPPKVLFAECKDKEIYRLYEDIEKRVAIASQKPFIPHVTLMRIKKTNGGKSFLKYFEKTRYKILGEMKLRLCLVSSTLTPEGPIYRTIHTF
ncbi:RNA 2',3'-cyclic phosphodiesterase [Nitrosophilus alvini]|uniref:RNA 2',3'-cyclic phosphodiesterase n=1 Tax=Nitrosophilus alvini TaxID=2714855 RepID=UPI00190DB02E|nr:RNA 2',3'-cyclic phosphodiesterase [Nitrosophilus alvini]